MATAKHGNRKANRKCDALSVAEWYHDLRKRTNDVYLRAFFDEHRFLVLMGGGSSGKSIFGGSKVLERCVHEPGHRFLVLRKIGKTIRHSCYDQLVRQAKKYYPEEILKIPKGQSGDMYIKFRNGSEILFSGFDDPEKIKSIVGVSGIWIEEATEFEEGDLNQLNIRLRDESPYYKQIIITFNPISVTHWLKKRFFDEPDENAYVMKTTYKDNRFLTPEEAKVLEDFRERDPYYYDVYCRGNWGVLGKTVFHKENLAKRREEHKKPILRGTIEYQYNRATVYDWTLQESDGLQDILVYDMPREGHPYVIGCDTAGEGSDWFVAQVIDNTSGEQVAKYRIKTDEDLFARSIFALGMIYNEALVAVEANFSTHPIKELERLGYRKLFMRTVEDNLKKQITERIGVKTDKLTRPIMISLLVEISRDYPELINDEQTIDEMLTFVRNDKGRAEAEYGSHDDCVLALAIAHYARPQQSMVVKRQEAKAQWRKDQWDDYYNAKSEAERKHLLKLWGNPF